MITLKIIVEELSVINQILQTCAKYNYINNENNLSDDKR